MANTSGLSVIPFQVRDRGWVKRFIMDAWGLPVVAHGTAFEPEMLEGFIAYQQKERVGLLTCLIHPAEKDGRPVCEIVTLNSLVEGIGVGTMLIRSVLELARHARCEVVVVTTTNDNLDALRFYQKRGFVISLVHPGAVDETRQTLKPKLPVLGYYGIPIRDEIELRYHLAG